MGIPAKEKPPLIEVEWNGRSLVGASSYDGELLEASTKGRLFRLEPARKRSLPQLRAYWRGLGIWKDAAGWEGTVEQLHEELKRSLGMYRTVLGPMGATEIVDSIAIDAMKQDEMNAFLERSRHAVMSISGFDPWGFLDAILPTNEKGNPALHQGESDPQKDA